MGIISRIQDEESKVLHIIPDTDLTSHNRAAFTDAYMKCDEYITGYVVDLEHVTYIDSSGLGLLLCLKCHASVHNQTFEVINLGEFLRNLLNFDNIDEYLNKA